MAGVKEAAPAGDAAEFVYSAYITLKSGKRLYARRYGLKAFRFKARRRKDR
ncbi:MAG: hypothetical protein ACREAA_16770 [Candidatus Polarisedimenticolia bacterium]